MPFERGYLSIFGGFDIRKNFINRYQCYGGPVAQLFFYKNA
ncbi:MAG: hypothetical protein Q8L11_01865 [Candidatus Moranbacteria bacterium]|nr:hypothetical protein [Candidatus Moranbacteria bacterium]